MCISKTSNVSRTSSRASMRKVTIKNKRSGTGRRIRSSRGSILTLVVLCLFGLVAIFMIVISMMMLTVTFHSAEHKSDGITLELAQIPNADNRLGDLNDMTVCSRQMIFSSRQNLSRTTENRNKQFQPLAEQMLAESRESSFILGREHRNQIENMIEAVHSYVWNFNNVRRSQSQMDNVILKQQGRKIVEVEVGTVESVQGSAKSDASTMPLLNDLDANAKLVDPRSGYYLPNKNIVLPYDDDLKFSIDSLAPAIEGTISPSRLLNQGAFKPTAQLFDKGIFQPKNLDVVPTAVRVVEEMYRI
jgi:hypothetical protein